MFIAGRLRQPLSGRKKVAGCEEELRCLKMSRLGKTEGGGEEREITEIKCSSKGVGGLNGPWGGESA